MTTTANQISLPGPKDPISKDGLLTERWYQWLQLNQAIVGSGNASVQSLQVQINQVSGVANEAELEAAAASAQAATAQTTADAAQTSSTTNTNSINTINTQLPNFLNKNNNLGDLTNSASARSNLGLSTRPYVITFDTCPITTRYIGIDAACIIPANFTGSIATSGINTTNNSTFSIGYATNLPGTISITPIGTLTFINGGNFYNFVGNAQQFAVGDFITISTPTPIDPSLAQVGITIQVVLL